METTTQVPTQAQAPVKEMTVADLVNAFRVKAKELDTMANTLSAATNLLASASGTLTAVVEKPEPKGPELIKSIKEYMKDKAFRAMDLAKHFNMSREDIDKLLTKENGFTVGKQLWIWVEEAQKKTT